jgi:hypothetical protein
MSYYNVYLLSSLGMPRNHHSIYIVTSPTNIKLRSNSIQEREQPPCTPPPTQGYIYQVSGNIQTGMTYNYHSTTNTEHLPDFISKEPLGLVGVEDYERGRVKGVCETVPAPKKQFEGPKRLFPSEDIRRCQEWTREAVSALKREGILEDMS